MSWNKIENEEIPNWVKQAIEDMPKGRTAGTPEFEEILHGDTFVYKVVMNENNEYLKHSVYKQLKSDYFDTNPQEGTCPNCQKYVKRYKDDNYLTCHRCGWQYKPLTERIKNLF